VALDRSALLVMDVQRGIVERFGNDAGYLRRLGTAIDASASVSATPR
jgi:hypothetical protein